MIMIRLHDKGSEPAPSSFVATFFTSHSLVQADSSLWRKEKIIYVGWMLEHAFPFQGIDGADIMQVCAMSCMSSESRKLDEPWHRELQPFKPLELKRV